MERYAEDLILQIRETVGRKNVLLGLSEVDSSVCALLIHKAVGDRLKCVFVDHGLLRKDEGAAVKALFEGDVSHQPDIRACRRGVPFRSERG